MKLGTFEILLAADLAKGIILDLLAEMREEGEPMTREEYVEIKKALDEQLAGVMAKIRSH